MYTGIYSFHKNNVMYVIKILVYILCKLISVEMLLAYMNLDHTFILSLLITSLLRLHQKVSSDCIDVLRSVR